MQQSMQQQYQRHIGAVNMLLNGGFIGPDATPANQQRGVVIMDALAAICVSEPRHQVIAVGLQMDHAKKRIRLVITGNSNLNEELSHVEDHIHYVWQLLQQISEIYAAERAKGDGGRKKWEDYVGESPEKKLLAPESAGFQLGLTLKVSIVRHSATKLYQRIRKRWTAFLEFGNVFRSSFEQLMTGSEAQRKVVLHLKGLVRLIGDLGSNLQEDCSVITTIFWSEERVIAVCNLLEAAWKHSKAIRDDPLVQVVIFRVLAQCGLEFDFKHYADKVLSLHGHFKALMSWAHSPRLRWSFFYELSTSVITSQAKYEAPLPRKLADWRRIVAEVLDSSEDLEPISDRNTFIDGVARQAQHRYLRSSRPVASECYPPVHCEVSLVAHYHTLTGSWAAIPPLNYIGVSKLSCLLCHYWISAYQKKTHRRFNVRGTHAKPYYPWGLPSLADVALEEAIVHDTAQDLKQYILNWWQEEGKLRSRAASDSSGVSNTSSDDAQEFFHHEPEDTNLWGIFTPGGNS